MSKVSIRYSDLDAAEANAGNLSRGLSYYSEDLSKKVRSALAKLPGSDDHGLISSAISNIDTKTERLNTLSDEFHSFSVDVHNFILDAKNADERVASEIKSNASSYVGKRNWFQSACDAIYNFLFIDRVNSNYVTRFLANGVKEAWHWTAGVVSNVYDWFKHGDGRYVWNIISAVGATISTIAGVITAVAGTLAAGCTFAVVLGVIGMVAAVTIAVITAANSAVKIYNNAKALKEDNPGISRYIGDINGLSDAIKKYDMGNAEDNMRWKSIGVTVDGVEVTCKIINIGTNVANLGAVKSDITGRTMGYRFDKENIVRNFRDTIGFDFDKENKYTLSKMVGDFGRKTTKRWYPNENGYGGLRYFTNLYTSDQELINVIFNGNEIISNTMSMLKDGDKVYSKLKSGLDFSTPESGVVEVSSTIVDVYSALGKFKLFGGINKFTVKPYKALTDILELFKAAEGGITPDASGTGG